MSARFPNLISTINLLPDSEKREIYTRLIPQALFDKFNLPEQSSSRLQSLLQFRFASGSSDVELSLFHEMRFPDPVLYGHMTDTLTGHLHILLYVLNDPDSPRFDVDKMPDGSPTKFGTLQRNIEAENNALQAGLAPGQVRRGLGLLSDAIDQFEVFVMSLGHEMYFTEPLYYHNAVLFERHGFSYQSGKKKMERIQSGFSETNGDLARLMDGSTPFREHSARDSIRLRSWAIHDGILGEPFSDVTMYKTVGKKAGVCTCPDCSW